MYDFTIVALMALALVKTVDFLVDQMPGFERMRSFLTFVGGIGAALALDYSLFRSWGIDISTEWMGTWLTGFMFAGVTSVWRAMFSYLTHQRSPMDESLGDHHPMLQRVS